MNSLKIFFSAPGDEINITKYIVMISKSASFRFVNFMAPGSEVLVLGRGSIDYMVKMH